MNEASTANQPAFVGARQLSYLAFTSTVLTFLLILLNRHSFNIFLLFEQIVISAFISSTILVLFVHLSRSKFESPKIVRFFTSADYWLLIALLTVLSMFIPSSTLLNIDRSRSFYVLNCVDYGLISPKLTNPEGIPVLAGIELRVKEQISRKLILEEEGKLVLTLAGETILKVASSLEYVFRLNNYTEQKNRIKKKGICLDE